jgi:hypothetical protein
MLLPIPPAIVARALVVLLEAERERRRALKQQAN